MPPFIHLEAEFIDRGRGRILLILSGDALAFVQAKQLLIGRRLSLPWLGNRRDELGIASGFEDPLSRLALVVKLPMPDRIGVRRIKDRMLEEAIIHVEPSAVMGSEGQ